MEFSSSFPCCGPILPLWWEFLWESRQPLWWAEPWKCQVNPGKGALRLWLSDHVPTTHKWSMSAHRSSVFPLLKLLGALQGGKNPGRLSLPLWGPSWPSLTLWVDTILSQPTVLILAPNFHPWGRPFCTDSQVRSLRLFMLGGCLLSLLSLICSIILPPSPSSLSRSPVPFHPF